MLTLVHHWKYLQYVCEHKNWTKEQCKKAVGSNDSWLLIACACGSLARGREGIRMHYRNQRSCGFLASMDETCFGGTTDIYNISQMVLMLWLIYKVKQCCVKCMSFYDYSSSSVYSMTLSTHTIGWHLEIKSFVEVELCSVHTVQVQWQELLVLFFSTGSEWNDRSALIITKLRKLQTNI